MINSASDPAVLESPPVITGNPTAASATDQVVGIVYARTPRFWVALAGTAVVLLGVLIMSVGWLLYLGVGIWGINIPVAWGFAITNFVWWIGIGHAGTLISAILLLLNQTWRNAINRSAEAMTLFAVACAGLFPLLHLGRVWLFYWLFPYPNTMSIQPQFRSPLVFDVFAVSTYATVSLLFWYVGMMPDLATMRDRAGKRWQYAVYSALSLGWRGSSHQWRLHKTASLLLAGLATPLVLSVHTVVSFDFAVSIVPGWHSTIFPPYFVAGAIYSGFAMVLILVIPLRRLYRLENLITERHLDCSAKLMLATGWFVAYAYAIEPFFAWYSGNEVEMFTFANRATGPYWWAFALNVLFNVAIPQALWWKSVRRNTRLLFAVSLSVLYGMWLERYVIIVSSLNRDYLPSSWALFSGTFWDHATFWGTVGLFLFLFALFIRLLPMISIYEIRELLHERREH